MDMKKIAVVIAALIASFSVSACPVQECAPGDFAAALAAQQEKAALTQRGIAWLEEQRNLKNPVEFVQHGGWVAAKLAIAMLEAENRALRRALETGEEPDYTSVRQLPTFAALSDAMNSDLLQVFVTGRMPQTEHFEKRLQASVDRSLIEEAGEKLGQPRKPRRIIE